jgi:hypothetical protein
MKNGLHVDINGTKRWFMDGKLHKVDGPATEWPSGIVGWSLNGQYLGAGASGFWAHWELLTHQQRCNLNLHFWLAKYS